MFGREGANPGPGLTPRRLGHSRRQLMVYLTDVTPETHCISFSPEVGRGCFTTRATEPLADLKYS